MKSLIIISIMFVWSFVWFYLGRQYEGIAKLDEKLKELEEKRR